MFASRPPCAALRPYVRLLWAGGPGADSGMAPCREHVLPTGTMHLALRLDGPPLRLLGATGAAPHRDFGHAVVGGARDTFYAREAGVAGHSVGAQLEPAAARALFAASTGELAGRHTELPDLWGPAGALLLEELQEAGSAARRLALLERHLLARLRPAPGLHPGVAAALACLQRGARVADAVRASGLSHRHLVLRFREATGLAPKQHARILRLQDALRALGQGGTAIAEAAAAAGYADQAHFTRDFRAFAGMTPGAWRRARPAHTHHVRVPQAG